MIEPCYRYRAEFLAAHDGDTYTLRIDLGFYASAAVPIRLRGVDTPELGTAHADESTAFARWHLSRAEEIVVESYRDARSFERWVADVYVDGYPLARRIIETKHGESYPPGPPPVDE